MKRLLVLLMSSAFFLCNPVWAQRVAPGLWEYTSSMKTGDGSMEAAMEKGRAQMKEQMAKMPPAQRKMMEEMMAKQGMGGAGKPMAMQLCITPEQAARDEVSPPQKGCKQLGTQRNGNTVHFKFSCEGPPPSTAEGEVIFQSDKAQSGHMVMDTQVAGERKRIEVQHSGRWLAASCGDVKPLQMPAAR